MRERVCDWICGCYCCGDDIIGNYTLSKEEFVLRLKEKGWVDYDGKWFCKYCTEKLGLKKESEVTNGEATK